MWKANPMHFLTASLQRKLLMALMVILTVVTGGVGTYLLNSQHRNALTDLETHATQIINLLSKSLAVPLWNIDLKSIQEQLEVVMLDPQVCSVTLYARGNAQPPLASRKRDSAPVAAIERDAPVIYVRDQPASIVELGTVHLVYTRSYVYQELQQTRMSILAVILLLLASVSAATYVLLRRMVQKPVGKLLAMTHRIAGGDLEARITVSSRDEIGLLSERFNFMTEKLKETMDGLGRSEAKLRRLNESLEARIRERTDELSGTVEQLSKEISERKQAEEILQSTLQRFYTVLSSLYAGTLLVTEDNVIEFANQAFCDLFDLEDSPEDLKGLSSAEMIEKIRDSYLDPIRAIARIREIVSLGQPVKCEEVPMRGGRACLRDYVPLLIDGKRWGRLWFHQDITGLKEAQQEVIASERKVLAMSQAVDDALVMLDSRGRVCFWNHAAENLFGYSADEAKGLNFHDLAAPPEDREKARAGLEKFAGTGDGAVFGSRMETRAIKPGGEPFPVEVSLSSFRVDNDWLAVGTVRGITKRKKAEEELKQYVDELERFNRLVVGREGTMIRLKKEINELREQSGLGPKYKIVE